VYQPFEPATRDSLLALNRPGDNELHRAAEAATRLASIYADVVQALLENTGLDAQSVRAIGAHGQTVRHQPHRPPQPARANRLPEPGYTIQLLNGAWLAELTRIDVVCDLRSADVAAGGQGAPLVPAAHHAWFARKDMDISVLNIGGIANLSLLPRLDDSATRPVTGFDTGPGNVLLDLWALQHWQQPFDAGGAWAAQGQVDAALLATLLADPYFGQNPPKSTGRDLFDSAWLSSHLAAAGMPAHGSLASRQQALDVQATLAELTVVSIAQDVMRLAANTGELLVCGGGARNTHLMRRLNSLLPQLKVLSTEARGYPVDQVEALAFAWLAKAFVEGRHANLPSVTGARRPRQLGALYPAS
jgi:anhydro-N-acetylmuramic acid kinase